MKRVKLEYDSETTISDSAFEQIAAIVKRNRVCESCGKPYTTGTPNVALNRCLPCFLRSNASQRLTYIKLYEVNDRGSEIHWFLDPFNVVSYTTSTSRDAQQNNYYTLLHWGFPVPETWHDGDETKQVIHWHWSIYGDPQADQVVVIHNTIDYGSSHSFDFLSYRDGRTIQIDRKRGEGRRLFLAAKKRIEATSDGQGYHVDGHTFYSIESYWLRRVVVRIANEEDQQRGKRMAELFPEELRKQVPPLYSQEHETDPMVYVKFFHPLSHWTWYATEFDPNEGLFFGWVYGDFPELGYFSLAEFEGFTGPLGIGIERDIPFSPMRLSEVKKLHAETPPAQPPTLTVYFLDIGDLPEEGGTSEKQG